MRNLNGAELPCVSTLGNRPAAALTTELLYLYIDRSSRLSCSVSPQSEIEFHGPKSSKEGITSMSAIKAKVEDAASSAKAGTEKAMAAAGEKAEKATMRDPMKKRAAEERKARGPEAGDRIRREGREGWPWPREDRHAHGGGSE